MAAAELTNLQAQRCIAAQYDFAIHGGAAGTISLRQKLPSGAIVVNSLIEVLTVPTSGGSATIAVTVQSAGDVVAATAIGSAPWSTTGRKVGVPDFATASDSFKCTADRDITAVVATADLTAGKFNVFLWYVLNTAA